MFYIQLNSYDFCGIFATFGNGILGLLLIFREGKSPCPNTNYVRNWSCMISKYTTSLMNEKKEKKRNKICLVLHALSAWPLKFQFGNTRIKLKLIFAGSSLIKDILYCTLTLSKMDFFSRSVIPMFIVHLQKFEIHGLLNSTFKTNKFDFDPSAGLLASPDGWWVDYWPRHQSWERRNSIELIR